MCEVVPGFIALFMLFMGDCNCEVHPILILLFLKVARGRHVCVVVLEFLSNVIHERLQLSVPAHLPCPCP